MSNPLKTYKEIDNDSRKGKKRYIERQIEEREAEKEIKDYIQKDKNEDSPNDSGIYRFHGLRSENC